MKQAVVVLSAIALLMAPLPVWAQTSGSQTPGTADQTSPPAATPAPTAPGMQQAPGTQEGTQQVQGKIKSLSRSKRTLTLEDGTKLTIPSSVKVSRKALKKGEMVTATYQEKGGKNVVTSIQVQGQSS